MKLGGLIFESYPGNQLCLLRHSTIFHTFYKKMLGYYLTLGDHGGTVVKVLCYKSEGRWFYSRWCHWHFSLT